MTTADQVKISTLLIISPFSTIKTIPSYGIFHISYIYFWQLAIVSKTLQGGERALVLADGGLVEDWIKTRRLLVIVSDAKADSYALFVYLAQNIPITSVEDLTINHVLPIDSDFKWVSV